jgi:UDP-N-acetylmuramoylalanine-D-glutamate ligase
LSVEQTTLVFGLGVAGMAVANALHERGETVILADDEATKQHEDFARALNCEFIDATATPMLTSQRVNMHAGLVNSKIPIPRRTNRDGAFIY